ncbi:unnamed protein product [Mytilus coruscus]|uniref:C-type lectin domain-containing protein n=1 Tax=Mytilus coruscus TaxID=42192 RepID=A0A6J8BCU1_MYTCO|nr:unnamed protein product [Mytilus coruscus]
MNSYSDIMGKNNCASLLRTSEFQLLEQYTNKFVSTGILWQNTVSSILPCAISCNNDLQCISFFYDNEICHGYDKTVPIVANMISSVGKEFYHTTDNSTIKTNTEMSTVEYAISSQRITPSSKTTALQETTALQVTTTLQETTALQETTTLTIFEHSTTYTLVETTPIDSTQQEPTTVGTEQEASTSNIRLESTTVKAGSSSEWCSGDRFARDIVGGKCYKAFDPPLSWSDAEVVCKGEGGNLAILDTDDKINLMAFIPDYQCAPGKIGPFVNKCYWTTSDLLSWADSAAVCNDNGSILASFSDNSTYFTVIDGLGILNGTEQFWLGINDRVDETIYKTYDDQPMTWDNFVFNGHFWKDCCAIIPAENYLWLEGNCDNEVHKAVCEHPLTTEFWVGGSDLVTENVWKWQTKANMDMAKWHGSQPDGSTAQNCATLKYDLSGTKFADEDCSQLRNFICEKAIH